MSKQSRGDIDLQAEAAYEWLKGQRDSRPSLEHLLVTAWRRPHSEDSKPPHAYASEALNCARKIGLRVASKAGIIQYNGSGSPSLQSLLAFKIGDEIHIGVQAVMKHSGMYKEFDSEAYWQLGDPYWLSGRADGIYTNADGGKTILEIKTMGSGWAFTQAKRRGAPSDEHLTQAMLSAYALRADEVHIVYIHKAAKGDAVALLEWFIPYDQKLVTTELRRLEEIVGQITAGVIPDRVYNGEVIDDPTEVKFPCPFCDFANICLRLGKGESTLDELQKTMGR